MRAVRVCRGRLLFSALMSTRRLTDSPMHVQPVLIGRELASPARRFLALALDEAILIVPTVLTAIAFAVLSMYLFERPAYDAVMMLKRGEARTDAQKQAALAAVLPMLVRAESRGLPREVEPLLEEGKALEAAELVKGYNISITVSFFGEGTHDPVPPKTVVLSLSHLIPGKIRGAALFFVPGLYFTVLTRGRRGATIGKRLVGIQVVRLDGHHLSWLESFERFVSYLHIPGTLFIALIDLWHDPNRRMGHDRAAHTAVLRKI